MSPSDVVVLFALGVGAVLLVAVNVGLQRLARPDRGTDRIAGCCGTALASDITTPAPIAAPREDPE
jgi:hypothetical protein